MAGYMMYRQDRTAASGKTRGGGLCIFVINSWCTISKEVSSDCSPEVEYLMISRRQHNLPREFSAVFFVAVYTKTALYELYFARCKQANFHPEATLLVAGDFNAGKLKSVLLNFYRHVKCKTRGKPILDHLNSIHKDVYKALPRPPFGKSDHNSILLIPT
jgi:hypothetical protein